MKKIISLLCVVLLTLGFVGCASSSKLTSGDKAIMNKSYSELTIDEKVVFEDLIRRDGLSEKDIKDIKDYVSKIPDLDSKKSFAETIDDTEKESKGLLTQVEKNTIDDSTAANTTEVKPVEEKALLSAAAIKVTTDTLLADTLVKDVSIVKDNETINIAIQVNSAINDNKAKDLVDTAIRQIGSNSGGASPTKDYYGEIWDMNKAHVRIFSGQSNVILDGYMNKGENKITY